MPKVTSGKITFIPEDRHVIDEQSPGITPSTYTTLFNSAISEGDTTKYFKFLEEIAEKDPDILHALETRTSYITSKEWTIEGENEKNAELIEKELRNIKGDSTEGLLSIDELIESMLGSSYLVGLSLSEIVSDNNSIIGFNHIPSHFLTFKDSVYYPRLWTAEKQEGISFNKNKMISHYLVKGIDPARGWLGNAISWLYVLKRTALEARLSFQNKYGKGFLLVNMPGDKDSYEKAWETAEELIENYSNTDGAVFPADVNVEFKEAANVDGSYFFTTEDDFKRSIVKVILGQESTSSSQDSNRSTASVHMEVLEQRVLDDISAIETTLTNQLIDKIKVLKGISLDDLYEFKFVMSDLEATMDEDMEDESAVEEEPTEDVSNSNGVSE